MRESCAIKNHQLFLGYKIGIFAKLSVGFGERASSCELARLCTQTWISAGNAVDDSTME
jgi:hypothetical protein